MLHPKIQGYLDHSYGNELIKHSIYPECLVSHGGNVSSTQESFQEDAINEDPLEDVDGHSSLQKDVVIDTWKEESRPLSFRTQHNELEKYFMEEELKEGI